MMRHPSTLRLALTALTALIVLVVWTAPAPKSGAADAPLPVTECTSEINARLAREQRIFRGVLFGVRPAESEPLNTTRYDREGNAWIKTVTNVWRTTSPGYEKTTWSDAQMDLQTERDALLPAGSSPLRRGIFGTKRVQTSDLVPELTQAYDALGCRTMAVCDAASRSLNADASYKQNGGFYVSRIPGCVPIRSLPLASCVFNRSQAAGAQRADALQQQSARNHCNPAAEQLLNREAEALKLATSYDAAYRSLLQFTGASDLLLSGFNADILTPLRHSMSLIGQLQRIPCFLSECNE